jgi:ArsR family metal-binding transcriptional regulator
MDEAEEVKEEKPKQKKKEEKPKQKVNKEKQTKKTKKASQTEIMNVYRNLKKSNPDLSFEDFCMMIAKGEVTLDKEDDGDEKE